MYVGGYGPLSFIVAGNYINTFDDFQRSGESRWAKHELIGKKPVLEFLGQGCESITFTMNFDVLFGVKPERELEKLRRIRDNGENYALVLGDKPVGKNNWVITGLAEAVKAFDGWGDMIKATVTVTMTEYVKNKGATS